MHYTFGVRAVCRMAMSSKGKIAILFFGLINSFACAEDSASFRSIYFGITLSAPIIVYKIHRYWPTICAWFGSVLTDKVFLKIQFIRAKRKVKKILAGAKTNDIETDLVFLRQLVSINENLLTENDISSIKELSDNIALARMKSYTEFKLKVTELSLKLLDNAQSSDLPADEKFKLLNATLETLIGSSQSKDI